MANEWKSQEDISAWLKSKNIYAEEDDKRKGLAEKMWELEVRDVDAIGTDSELLERRFKISFGVASKLVNKSKSSQARRGRKKRKRNQSPGAPVNENNTPEQNKMPVSENNTPEQNKMSYLDSFVNWAFGSSSDAKKNLTNELGNEKTAASVSPSDELPENPKKNLTTEFADEQPAEESTNSNNMRRRKAGGRKAGCSRGL